MSAIDPNEIPGWTVQAAAPNPYSQPGIVAAASALTTVGNGNPGAPGPLPSDETDILTNPGYADVSPWLVTPGSVLAADLVPVPASGTVFASPVALAAAVDITGTVTAVRIAPAGGALAEVGTADGSYTVPPGGSIELAYSSTAPSWTWTLI